MLPASSPLVAVARSAILIGYCGILYMLVYSTFTEATASTWSFLITNAAISVLGFLLISMALVDAVLKSSTAENWPARTAGALLALVGLTVVPCAVAATRIRPVGLKRRRGVLLELATRKTFSMLQRTSARQLTDRSDQLNKLAVVSLITSPIFPFGLIMADVALRQIDAAERHGRPQRGRWQVQAATVIAWVSPIVVVIPLTAIVVINPVWK